MSDILARLEQLIAERRDALATDAATVTDSYVARQLAKGPLKMAQKVGEEGVETAIAGVAEDDASLVSEVADLIFHLLLLLGGRGISFSDVLTELERREGISGIAEKEGRKG